MEIVQLTENNFNEQVIQSEIPVIVDFWAPWCGPCKMLGPILEEAAGEQDVVKVAKLNVDTAMSIAQKYGIVSIPALIVFKNGVEVNRSVGLISKSELKALMEV